MSVTDIEVSLFEILVLTEVKIEHLLFSGLFYETITTRNGVNVQLFVPNSNKENFSIDVDESINLCDWLFVL